MRTLSFLSLAFILLTGGLNAALLTITLENPNFTASPGSTATYRGTIANTSSSVLSLDFASASIDTTLTPNTDPFLLLPFTIEAGETFAIADLFTIEVPANFTPLNTIFTGDFNIFGGIPGQTQELIGATTFTFTVTAPTNEPNPVPEPATYATALTALTLLALARRHS